MADDSADAPPPPGDNRLGALADDLADRGWSILDGWPDPVLVAALADAARRHHAADDTRVAAVGRSDEAVVDRSLRRAEIRWLEGADPLEARFLAAAETLRLALNARLFLGLFAFEACYAVYPPGGFYARHADALRGQRNRIVSLVTYLNPHWDAGQGGALVIYGRDGARAAAVEPRAGTSVLMLSEEIEHEVRPTAALRLAVAGWWRVNEGPAAPPA
ncbi:MAG: 2OG-Fe(II) oxygenase [Alphaproteobacteria bacterium]